MSMARRKKADEEPISHERWLVSYADFITLLFAFFTSLYAISTIDAEKAGKMVFSTRAAFSLGFFPTDKPLMGVPPSDKQEAHLPPGKVLAPLEQPSSAKVKDWQDGKVSAQRVRALARELERYVTRESLDNEVVVRLERRGLVVSLAAAALFAPGSTQMKRESLRIVDSIAEKLIETGLHLRVEGHTDDLPSASGRSTSDWRISTERALNVVTYLVEEFAYPAHRLSAAGFAAYRPLADNVSPRGRAANRRVDLVLEYAPAERERE
jgi:chemotaxis protein MotB